MRLRSSLTASKFSSMVRQSLCHMEIYFAKCHKVLASGPKFGGNLNRHVRLLYSYEKLKVWVVFIHRSAYCDLDQRLMVNDGHGVRVMVTRCYCLHVWLLFIRLHTAQHIIHNNNLIMMIERSTTEWCSPSSGCVCDVACVWTPVRTLWLECVWMRYDSDGVVHSGHPINLIISCHHDDECECWTTFIHCHHSCRYYV